MPPGRVDPPLAYARYCRGSRRTAQWTQSRLRRRRSAPSNRTIRRFSLLFIDVNLSRSAYVRLLVISVMKFEFIYIF